ncbi:hypothetical protein [Cupriavidus sp. TMH.W2]|uniref:hypothetical protein n=1 Tax=Cupriavidus sp. TMH.W2 TaxID=3434465 RepID=UPI003D77BC29
MRQHEDINADLHRRLDDGVRAGTIEASASEVAPRGLSVETLVDNMRAGRPLLEGMTVFRGAKDPDVDAGTFGGATKHATPVLAVAQGYAAFSNEHIGLRCPATRGIGMLAEYALPLDAVFRRNFGLESEADTAASGAGMTRAAAEQALAPLVAAYDAAEDAPSRDAARRELEAYVGRELYELALPADAAPLRQFVVQSDDAGRSRLLVLQESGPIADVVIDVLRERKAAVDRYHADRLLRDLSPESGVAAQALDALQAGLGGDYARVAAHVASHLNAMQDADRAVPLSTVTAALAWRRAAQADVRMAQLTNSGIVIEHADPTLQRVAALRDALETIEHGATAARWLGERQPVGRELRNAAHAAEMHAGALAYDVSTEDDLKRAENELQKWQGAKGKALGQYRGLHANHTRQMQRNLIQRLWYRMRRQSGVETELQRRAQALGQLNARLRQVTVAAERAREVRATAAARLAANVETLDLLRTSIVAMRKEGAMDYLGDVARLADKRALSAQDLTALAAAADASEQPLLASVMAAQTEARALRAIAESGLNVSAADAALDVSAASATQSGVGLVVESPDAKAPHAPRVEPKRPAAGYALEMA